MPGPSDLEFLTQIGQNHREIILVLIAVQRTDVLEEGVHQLGAGYRTRLFEPSFLVQLIRDSIRDKETTGTAENGSRIMHKLGEPAGSSFLPDGGSVCSIFVRKVPILLHQNYSKCLFQI
jgi:hypothetical protein